MVWSRLWFGLLLVGAAALAACSDGTTAPMPTSGPTACPALLTIKPPTVIYPPAGATAVPDGNFNVILAYAYGTVTAVAANGNAATAASPVPAPSGTAVAYAMPPLQTATTYTLIGTLTVAPGCSSSTTLETFTTQ